MVCDKIMEWKWVYERSSRNVCVELAKVKTLSTREIFRLWIISMNDFKWNRWQGASIQRLYQISKPFPLAFRFTLMWFSCKARTRVMTSLTITLENAVFSMFNVNIKRVRRNVLRNHMIAITIEDNAWLGFAKWSGLMVYFAHKTHTLQWGRTWEFSRRALAYVHFGIVVLFKVMQIITMYTQINRHISTYFIRKICDYVNIHDLSATFAVYSFIKDTRYYKWVLKTCPTNKNYRFCTGFFYLATKQMCTLYIKTLQLAAMFKQFSAAAPNFHINIYLIKF